MTTIPEQLQTLSNKITALRALVNGVRSSGILYAIAGDFCVFGCKVTQGASATDMYLALDGQATGDEANLNPDIVSPPLLHEEYPNIALIYGEVMELANINKTDQSDDSLLLDDAPSTADYGRYDLVYGYIGQSGPAVSILTGTASAAVKTDFVANGLDTTAYPSATGFDPTLPARTFPLARVYVQTGDTGIANARIADLRNFTGRLQGADGTSGGYVYIAYASDDAGTGFTTTFNPALDYIAILSSATEIVSPVVGDFTGLWKNYGGGAGDFVSNTLATAENDFIAASGAGVFVKKTLAEVKTILGLGTAAYTASTAYDAAGAATTAVSGHESTYNHASYVSALSQMVALELAAVPRSVYWVYGDSTDGGTTPDATTQASIDALLAAGVPADNIRWLYETTPGAFVIADITSSPTIGEITLELAGGSFVIANITSSPTIEEVVLDMAGGTFAISDITSQPTIENIVLVDADSGEFIIADITSSPTIEEIVLTLAGGTFAIADITSSPTIENIVLEEAAGGTALIPTNPSFETDTAFVSLADMQTASDLDVWFKMLATDGDDPISTATAARVANATMTGSYVADLYAKGGWDSLGDEPTFAEANLGQRFTKAAYLASNGVVTFDLKLVEATTTFSVNIHVNYRTAASGNWSSGVRFSLFGTATGMYTSQSISTPSVGSTTAIAFDLLSALQEYLGANYTAQMDAADAVSFAVTVRAHTFETPVNILIDNFR